MTKENIDNDPYKSAGVDITAGNNLIELIKGDVTKTQGGNVLGGIGGFAGMYKLNKDFKNPVLVACTDEVGTKVALAQQYNNLEYIGQDLVAMCVNDLVTCGAQPLFFLDYFATSKLNVSEASLIIGSIARACRASGCALLGGETAEMPGHYAKNNFDLAGFSVGVVEKKELIDGKGIKPGHVLLGIESSGPHSNGYSLIRAILKKHKAPDSIMRTLLKPTHLYPAPVLELIKKINVKGMAHITGGGLTENIPRILKKGLIADVQLSSWKFPKAFLWLQEKGKISTEDMLRIFNCGIGMVCILDQKEVSKAQKILSSYKLRSFEIGSITKGNLEGRIQYN